MALVNAEQSAYSYSGEDKYSTCTFYTNLNWGYTAGIEYNCRLSQSPALAMELSVEQYNYTPKKSKVEQVYAPSTNSKKVLNIRYVKKIDHFDMLNDRFQTRRLKESILFNSLYFGIGIKYTLGNK
ncbi:hypothetical protein [Viscerimonas tarda]